MNYSDGPIISLRENARRIRWLSTRSRSQSLDHKVDSQQNGITYWASRETKNLFPGCSKQGKRNVSRILAFRLIRPLFPVQCYLFWLAVKHVGNCLLAWCSFFESYYGFLFFGIACTLSRYVAYINFSARESLNMRWMAFEYAPICSVGFLIRRSLSIVQRFVLLHATCKGRIEKSIMTFSVGTLTSQEMYRPRAGMVAQIACFSLSGGFH